MRLNQNMATRAHFAVKLVNCYAVKLALSHTIFRVHTLPFAVYRVGTGPVRCALEQMKTFQGDGELRKPSSKVAKHKYCMHASTEYIYIYCTIFSMLQL